MGDYGVTKNGVAIKRLDTILNELHDDCSAGFGVNTRLNSQSYLNVLLTNFADKIAELWEFGEEVYYAMYPSSAEGQSLDNAAQFGGSVRESAAKTIYPIHCEGVEGTEITGGFTTIASRTNPVINFIAADTVSLSRSRFNKVKISALAVQPQAVYTVALNGALYSYTSPDNPMEEDILLGLCDVINDTAFTASVSEGMLQIEALNNQSANALVLTENLTTESVTCVVNFASEEYGEYILPDGAITQIVTAVSGLRSCINHSGYISGRLQENDIEFRKSYANKIFSRSTRMLDSVKSAILLNVQGVKSVSAYENDTPEWDSEGRPPHSIEVIVDGGSDAEIGAMILNKKAGGIVPFGSVEVPVVGEEGETVIIRFNRPVYVYVWFKVMVTMSAAESLPPNYAELVKEAVLIKMASLEAGKNVVAQRFIADIHNNVTGIDYAEVAVFYSEDASMQPGSYNENVVPITARQRAVTDETRIEVVLVADKFNYLETLIDDFPEQFRNQPNILVMVKALARQLQEAYEFIQDLAVKRWLGTAQGWQLDGIGDVVALSRQDAANLMSGMRPGEVMDDEIYREFLAYKILVNTNTCTYPDVLKALKFFWKTSPLYYSETPEKPATMTFTTPALKPDDNVFRLFKIPVIKAAGVCLEFMATTESEKTVAEIRIGGAALPALSITNLPELVWTQEANAQIRLGVLKGIITVTTLPEIESRRRL